MGCNCNQTGQWHTIDHPHDEAEIRMVSESVRLHGPEALKNATAIVSAHNECQRSTAASSQVTLIVGIYESNRDVYNLLAKSACSTNAQRDGGPDPTPPCVAIPPGATTEQEKCLNAVCIVYQQNRHNDPAWWDNWYADERQACMLA